MTHMSPASLLFASMCISTVLAYFLWHSWSFDKFASMRPTKRRAFKCGITWAYLFANACFLTWSLSLAYIKYTVGYQYLPTISETIPTPFALWCSSYQAITPALYYILVGGLCMIVMIYVEEMCFWLHLSSSIRGTTTCTWMASVYFKIWLRLTLLVVGSMIALVVPVNGDPDMMEARAFLIGTTYHTLFTIGSLYLIFTFPKLIDTVRQQGGSQMVLKRLAYHRKLTFYRLTEYTERRKTPDLFIKIGLAGFMVSVIISVYLFFPPLNASPERPLLPALQPSCDEGSTEPISVTRSPTGRGGGMSSAFTNDTDYSPHTFSERDDIEKHRKELSFTAAGGRHESRDDGEKDDLEEYYFKELEDDTKAGPRGMGMGKLDVQRVTPFTTPPISPTSPTIPTATNGPLPLTTLTKSGGGEKKSLLISRCSKANSSTSNAATLAPSSFSPSRPGTGGSIATAITSGLLRPGTGGSEKSTARRNIARNGRLYKHSTDVPVLLVPPTTITTASPSSSSRAPETSPTTAIKEQQSSVYAWSIFADHLRLPDNVMPNGGAGFGPVGLGDFEEGGRGRGGDGDGSEMVEMDEREDREVDAAPAIVKKCCPRRLRPPPTPTPITKSDTTLPSSYLTPPPPSPSQAQPSLRPSFILFGNRLRTPNTAINIDPKPFGASSSTNGPILSTLYPPPSSSAAQSPTFADTHGSSPGSGAPRGGIDVYEHYSLPPLLPSLKSVQQRNGKRRQQ
ncbi:hypothetical protein IAR50_003126 [Cryptococcus sp. DSM 104548]